MSRLKSASGPYEEGATSGGQIEVGWGPRSTLGFLFLLTSCRQLSISASSLKKVCEFLPYRWNLLTCETWNGQHLSWKQKFFWESKEIFKVHLIHLYMSREESFARSHSINSRSCVNKSQMTGDKWKLSGSRAWKTLCKPSPFLPHFERREIMRSPDILWVERDASRKAMRRP